MSTIMSTSPYPERFGRKARELRERRRLSRHQLEQQIWRRLGMDHPGVLRISDGFFKRLESGKVKKIDYTLVDTLARGLDCTAQERADLFLAAGLNFFDDGGELVSVLDTELAYVSTALKSQAALILAQFEHDAKEGHKHTPDEVRFAIAQALLLIGAAYKEGDAP